MLGSMGSACVTYKSYNLFSKEVVPLDIPKGVRVPIALNPHQHLALSLILILATLVGALSNCYEPGTVTEKTQFIPSQVDIFVGEENT